VPDANNRQVQPDLRLLAFTASMGKCRYTTLDERRQQSEQIWGELEEFSDYADFPVHFRSACADFL
jgi:hypothetical protein